MKKQLLVLIMVLTFSFQGKGQWVSIPDNQFAHWLSLNYLLCLQGNDSTGWQMDTTCNQIILATEIQCQYSSIISLEGIQYFDNLTLLWCGSHIQTITALPNSLISLDCSGNKLTSLPTLPNSLKHLNCDYNLLTSLPTLPNSLIGLSCNGNQLTSLPTLPNSLIGLSCIGNQLTSLPTLPLSVHGLRCDDNLLNAVPDLPDSLEIFTCSNNPNLTCLPKLKRVGHFEFNNTAIACLPNYPESNTYSSPPFNTYPICDSLNNNGCPFCYAHFSIHPDSANTGVYYGYNQSAGTNLTSYLWEFGDGDTSSLQFPSHTYAQAGQYNVCLTVSSPNCTNTFCDSSFLVFKTEGGLMNQLNIIDASTGIPHTEFPSRNFSLSPNPATHQVSIQVAESMATGFVSVIDVTGQTVMQFQLSATQTNLSTQHLPDGIYLITLQHQGQRSTQKLAITHY